MKDKIMVESPVEKKEEPKPAPQPVKPKKPVDDRPIDEILFERAVSKLVQNPETKEYVLAAFMEEKKEEEQKEKLERGEEEEEEEKKEEPPKKPAAAEPKKPAKQLTIATPSPTQGPVLQRLPASPNPLSPKRPNQPAYMNDPSPRTPVHPRPVMRRASQPNIPGSALPHGGRARSYTATATNYNAPPYTRGAFQRSASINGAEGLYGYPSPAPSAYPVPAPYGSPAPVYNPTGMVNTRPMSPSFQSPRPLGTPVAGRRRTNSTNPFEDPYLTSTIPQYVPKENNASSTTSQTESFW